MRATDTREIVILLVDGDVGVQFSIWKSLKADGFRVLTAGNKEAAMEASRNHRGPVDLLLTAVEMPQMSGLELYRTIAGERPGIKVLMMSRDLRWGERASIEGWPFLQMPCSSTTLRKAIHATLGQIPRATPSGTDGT